MGKLKTRSKVVSARINSEEMQAGRGLLRSELATQPPNGALDVEQVAFDDLQGEGLGELAACSSVTATERDAARPILTTP